MEPFGYADTKKLDELPLFAQKLNAFPANATNMPDNLKVVFIGDGDGRTSLYTRAALFNPDFVIYNADLDYGESTGNPETWMRDFDSYFGTDMPLFSTIGNHDSCMWFESNTIGRGKAWETVFAERYARLGLNQYCAGTIGISNACFYKGFYFLESWIGELSGQNDPGYLSHLRTALEAYKDAPFKMCSWHKNQQQMQLCTKTDSIGWQAYEICRQYGAIINNAHEHSYARTYTMNSFASNSQLRVDNFANDVTLDFGKTFLFVNGLSGSSIRNECDGYGSKEWWASWAAGNGNKGVFGNTNQGSSYGYVGCTFKPNGVANRADCFFEDVNGRVFDRYSIYSNIQEGSTPPPTAPTASPPAPTPPLERACRREYDTPSSGYSPQRYARCGTSGTCCRSKEGENNCYYTAGDQSACDDIPATCTATAYCSGNSDCSDTSAECRSQCVDNSQCTNPAFP
jgi:hypothetical protein